MNHRRLDMEQGQSLGWASLRAQAKGIQMSLLPQCFRDSARQGWPYEQSARWQVSHFQAQDGDEDGASKRQTGASHRKGHIHSHTTGDTRRHHKEDLQDVEKSAEDCCRERDATCHRSKLGDQEKKSEGWTREGAVRFRERTHPQAQGESVEPNGPSTLQKKKNAGCLMDGSV